MTISLQKAEEIAEQKIASLTDTEIYKKPSPLPISQLPNTRPHNLIK